MNIKVGVDVHYVPDILFEDGTYKDADDYIKTVMWMQKQYYNQNYSQKKGTKTEKKTGIKIL